ncbi:MAG TPA: phosphoenolpyruvate--protein phosphotransferase [Thermodesulfobacteriota bacterium]|nr:phosphoenolpyruvate--protein phosphotransferase [Thermodesulfobacteriota bacterium]
MKTDTKKEVILMRGIGVSSGIVIGKAYVVDRRTDAVQFCHLDPSQAHSEVKRFTGAVSESKKQLRRITRMLTKEGRGKEHIGIIDAHLMILKDQMLINDTIKLIKQERMNAEWALKTVLKGIRELFDKMDDRYFKERSSDIEHIVDRIIMNLSGEEHASIADIEEPSVVVAHDLSPADTAQMVKGKVVAFLTDIGGKTSHTAIMARSLEIPAVVGLENVTRNVEAGDTIIVDGMTGAVIINPSESVLHVYERRRSKYASYDKELHHYRNLPAETLDGRRIRLMGNMEIAEEITSLLDHGAEGIGLYRSEFLYLNRKDLPTEEEHMASYVHVAKQMSPRPVVVRTLDIGGDKFLSPMEVADEINPAMGLRAIRLCLKRPDMFITQLRGILRASAHGKLKVMFPMISGIDELRRAKAIFEETKEELRRENKPFDPDIEVGVMIEVPSAAFIADLLAKEADFFSIGTNDLLQYSLAIDRVNEHVAYLYEPFHPAVLRIIKNVVDCAKQRGISVSVCGEMAGEPEHALMFIGMGLEQLSMNAFSLLRVKRLVRSVRYEDAKDIVTMALTLSTAREVENYVSSKVIELYREEFYG